MSAENLKNAIKAVGNFWDEYEDSSFKYPGQHALAFADTEIGEAESRWLRHAYPDYVQNSNKPRDIESVWEEFGDASFMLSTAFLFFRGNPEKITSQKLPIKFLSEAWFNETARIIGMARDTHQAMRNSLVLGLVYNLLLRLAYIHDFNILAWTNNTINKIVSKHDLKNNAGKQIQPVSIEQVDEFISKSGAQVHVARLGANGELLVYLWNPAVLREFVLDSKDSLRIPKPSYRRLGYQFAADDAFGTVLFGKVSTPK